MRKSTFALQSFTKPCIAHPGAPYHNSRTLPMAGLWRPTCGPTYRPADPPTRQPRTPLATDRWSPGACHLTLTVGRSRPATGHRPSSHRLTPGRPPAPFGSKTKGVIQKASFSAVFGMGACWEYHFNIIPIHPGKQADEKSKQRILGVIISDWSNH